MASGGNIGYKQLGRMNDVLTYSREYFAIRQEPCVLSKRQLLVVDDEPEIGEFIYELAREAGFEASAITEAADFERHYNDDIHVVVLDLFMPDRDGIELLRSMAALNSRAAIVLVSGYDKTVLSAAKKLAREQGLFVAGTLTKPFNYEQIKRLLSSLALARLDNRKQSGLLQFDVLQEDDLRRALDNDELLVYFQPQLRLSNGDLCGVEALVRWKHPEHGVILPTNFIPLAEQTGLIDRLTEIVLEKSLRQASQWKQSGLSVNVSVNMPTTSFKSLDLPEFLSKKISDYGLEPGNITLEITETILMQELAKSLDILTRIRMKGISLSIDDFGTGYSSMVQLYRIPFSELKIDLSFVTKASTEPEALAIVKMIIMLGHELGMTIVAEGVEDRVTWDLLNDLGCDIGQGHYMSPPMEGTALSGWRERTLAKNATG